MGCKKYPDDKRRSFKSPEKRILHKWILKQFTVNGGDSTLKYYKAAYQNDSLHWKLGGSSVEFKESNDKSDPPYHYVISTLSGTLKCDLQWSFTEKKNRLSFQPYLKSPKGAPYYFIFLFPCISGGNGVWDIIRLDNEEMVLELTNNAKKRLKVRFQRDG